MSKFIATNHPPNLLSFRVVDSDNKQVSPKPLIVDFTSTLTGYKCPMCFENVIVIDELDVIVKTLMEHVQTEVGDPKNIEIWIDGDHVSVFFFLSANYRVVLEKVELFVFRF